MTTGTSGPSAAASPHRNPLRWAISLWPWLPVPLGSAYLVVIAVKFTQLIEATYLNADAASAPVIGQLYGGAVAGRQVILGQLGWFSTLLFELATRWLPLHRQLWEAAPYAMALASIVLIGTVVLKIAGRWAASITVVLLLCAGPSTLLLLLSLNDHSSTWFSIAVLAAALALFESPHPRIGAWMLATVVVLAGVIVGVNAASDPLVLVGGLAPMLLGAGACWMLHPERLRARAWWWTVGTLTLAAIADLMTRSIMRKANVLPTQGLVHTQLVSAAALSHNLTLWWQSLMVLGDGDFFGQRFGFTPGLELGCALLALTALGVAMNHAWRELIQRQQDRALPVRLSAAPARASWCVFWGSCAVLLSGAFIFSTNPQDLMSDRYLVGVLYAVAALIPLATAGAVLRRALITGGTSFFALTGIVTLVRGQELIGTSAASRQYSEIARIAAANHLHLGYAQYWDAAPLTWATHMRLRVYPVLDCPGRPALCFYYLHVITSWYKPRRDVRSFLISDSAKPPAADPVPNLGRANATYHVGTMTMYVYDYDLAQAIQRP